MGLGRVQQFVHVRRVRNGRHDGLHRHQGFMRERGLFLSSRPDFFMRFRVLAEGRGDRGVEFLFVVFVGNGVRPDGSALRPYDYLSSGSRNEFGDRCGMREQRERFARRFLFVQRLVLQLPVLNPAGGYRLVRGSVRLFMTIRVREIVDGFQRFDSETLGLLERNVVLPDSRGGFVRSRVGSGGLRNQPDFRRFGQRHHRFRHVSGSVSGFVHGNPEKGVNVLLPVIYCDLLRKTGFVRFLPVMSAHGKHVGTDDVRLVLHHGTRRGDVVLPIP